MSAEEILKLLESRYPDHTPLIELSQFRLGELAAYQKIITEIGSEIKNAKGK